MKEEYLRLHTAYMRLNGKELDDLSFKELKQLENQLNEGIASVKQQKEKILMEQLKRSRLQEQKTIMENEDIRKQVEELRQKRSSKILELNPLLERRLDHSPNNSKADYNNSASDDDNHHSDTSLHLGPNGTFGEVYIPWGDKALNGGYPKRAIPAYEHNSTTSLVDES
ncbi:hypothetical protein PVK06_041905 [Gossypium arboreum]|uniref:K-box domain-containing protein n=1 Tax=Gossypium arboreum TaxID=29729 RepID=A0ABR0N9H9_GOSAR|nr:hypothetical protein PVK06_041905 [Gossypium arboreum]